MPTPAYTLIDALATNDPLPSATINQIRDNMERFISPPGCAVFRGTFQTIPADTLTVIEFTTADERDTDGYHSTSVDPGKITIPTGLGGWYDAKAQMKWDASATGDRYVAFRVNGTTTYRGSYVNAAAGGITEQSFPIDIELDEDDYVELVVQHSSSGGDLGVAGRVQLRWVARS